MRKAASLRIIPAALALMLLSGCFFKTGEELYSLPKPPAEYLELQDAIDKTLSAGAEYSAPVSGSNRQSVQLRDIDGDGKDEAVAFFKTGDEKPLKIIVFQMLNDKYETAAIIEGDGTSIDSVNYYDLDGDGIQEIVAGWRMSSGVAKALTVHSVKDWSVRELARSNYSVSAFTDLDSDTLPEILVIRFESEEKAGVAELLDFGADDTVTSTTASMSEGISSVSRIKSGYLEDMIPAVFVASKLSEGSSVVTDIFALSDSNLKNITLDMWTGVSNETLRSYVTYATDIDLDGVMELPNPVQFPVYSAYGSSEKFWKIYWRSYYLDGTPNVKMVTYHNYADGWFIRLPQKWADNITVTRDDSVSGQRTVTFLIWRGEDVEPAPFLRIHTLTGDNRHVRASLGGRATLVKTADTVYAYEFLQAYDDWEYAVDRTQIVSRFSLISKEWNTGET
ncbi:MAG: FG-GAP repeat domain-containing protein [Oscillospiraceae bacterium]|jgi:hypothetical protein